VKVARGSVFIGCLERNKNIGLRAKEARSVLSRCRLCGRGCGADRLAGEIGRCGAGLEVKVAAHLLHFGEEPPLSGTRGSGTIFFSGCPLTCVFCQNHRISQDNLGETITTSELAGLMLDLQAQGAHNINLVSPTPWVPRIIEALAQARSRGLSLPLVYNTGGYDRPAALKLMEGLVDVYLPDLKYADHRTALACSGAADYPTVNRIALEEMFNQVGPLQFDPDGLAVRGLLIRHLVLPHNLAGTDRVLAWLKAAFGPEVWLSLMAQYFPSYQTAKEPDRFPELARPLTQAEYDRAVETAVALGLENVFIQEPASAETYRPDFDSAQVFARTD